jgi:hypothetical protein
MIGHQPREERSDSGQITMMFALLLGVFLVAFIGFATDYTNFWFQRQSVQSASDATCQAAAVDLLLYAAGVTTNSSQLTPSSSGVNCANTSTASPCLIAKYNGYNGGSNGATVQMGFPTSVTGFTATSGVSFPFVTVNISQNAKAYFSTLLTRQSTQTIHASATCGLVYNLGAGSVLVLRPYPQITTFTLAAGTTLKVVGGSTTGVQVNADSIHATSFGSGAEADLSLGGSSNSGSDFGVTGQQSDPGTTTYARGSTGQWESPDLPEINPYLGFTAPSQPSPPAHPTGTTRVQGDGCPITTSPYCTEYAPGYYSTGLSIPSGTFALLQPGLYYLNGDFTVSSGAYVRNATGASYDSHYGVIFYFVSGKPNITATDNTFTAMSSTKLSCNGTSSPPTSYNIPSTLNGNVLFAPCTTDGTVTTANNYQGTTSGTIRGFLFWMSPSDTSTTPSITGSSNTTSVYAGTEVLHNSSYGVNLTITGYKNDGIFLWGSIATDIFNLADTSSSTGFRTDVLLNGTGSSPTSKVALLQ